MRRGRSAAPRRRRAPLVLLSGHAATWELDRGGFQEIRQADMAAPVTKAAWTARSAATLGHDVGRGDPDRHIRAVGPGSFELAIGSARGAGRKQRDRLAGTQMTARSLRRSRWLRPMPSSLHGRRRTADHPRARDIERPARVLGQIGGRDKAAVNMESPAASPTPRSALSGLVRHVDLIGCSAKRSISLRGGHRARHSIRCALIAIDPEAALVERAANEKGD